MKANADEEARLESSLVVQEYPTLEGNEGVYTSRALGFFTINSSLRATAIRIVDAQWFTYLVLAVIVVNTGFISASTPSDDPSSTKTRVLDVAELTFMAFFTLEMMLKILAFGAFAHHHAYLRSGWNVFDFTIVCLGYLSLMALPILAGSNVTALRTLRVFRPLRTLRTIRWFRGPRTLVRSVIVSLPGLFDATVLLLFFIAIYGIMGVQLFGGALRQRCVHASTGELAPLTARLCGLADNTAGLSCPPDYVCTAAGPNPGHGFESFDHFGVAVIVLWNVLNLDGWSALMYSLQDAVSPWVWLYFVTFTLLLSFFAVTLFLAILTESFTITAEEEEVAAAADRARSIRRQASQTGVAAGVLAAAFAAPSIRSQASEPQPTQRAASLERGWSIVADARRVADNTTWLEGKPAWIVQLNAVVRSPTFFFTVLALILLNTVVLAAEHHGMSPALKDWLDAFNVFFIVLFAIELAIRIVGLGPRQFGKDYFNVFDSLVVALSILEVALGWSSAISVFRVVRLLRVVRILRVMRFVNRLSSLRRLLDTVTSGIAAVSYTAVLLFLLLFIFAIVGMELFGGSYSAQPGRANFDTLYWSFVAVFQTFTGDRSSDLLYEGMRTTTVVGAIYFVALTAVSIILKFLFLAVILHYFTHPYSPDDPLAGSLSSLVTQDSGSTGTAAKQQPRTPTPQLPDPPSPPQGRIPFPAVPASMTAAPSPPTPQTPAETAAVGSERSSDSASPSPGGDSLRTAMFRASAEASRAAQQWSGAKTRTRPRSSSLRWQLRSKNASRFTPEKAEAFQVAPIPSYSDLAKLRQQKIDHANSAELHRLATVKMFTAAPPKPKPASVVSAIAASKHPLPPSADPYAQDAAETEAAAAASSVPVHRRLGVALDDSGYAMSMRSHQRAWQAQQLREQLEASGTIAHDHAVEPPPDPSVLDPSGPSMRSPLSRGADAPRRKRRKRRVRRLPDAASRLVLVKNELLVPRGGREAHARERAASRERSAHPRKRGSGLPLVGYACFLSRRSWIRVWLHSIVSAPWFEPFINVCIVLNCVFMALDHPAVDSASPLGRAIFLQDWGFLLLFTAEVLAKMVVYGVWWAEYAYLRDNWNRVDAAVVALAWLGLPFGNVLRGLRGFRALRPLRLVIRSAKLRLVVTALSNAVPSMLQIVVITLVFWLMFGIMGVTLFKGLFYACNDPSVAGRAECVGAFDPDPVVTNGTLLAGTAIPRVWANAPYSFDNIGEAMLTLFEVSMLHGWADIMRSGTDATSVDLQPSPSSKPAAAIYFIAFIVFGSLFVLNLYIGVVLDHLNQMTYRRTALGSGRLASMATPGLWSLVTPAQRKLILTQRVLEATQPERPPPAVPTNPFRFEAYRLVSAPLFEVGVVAAILLNGIILTIAHYQQPSEVTDTLFVANVVFVILFTLELVLKVAAWGPTYYLGDGWNRFDAAVVALSLLGLALRSGVAPPTVRVLRVGRLFRLAKRTQTLNRLFKTLLHSLPSLFNIGALVGVVFFVYALLGVSLFGRVRVATAPGEPGFSPRASFSRFDYALLTLYRVATTDGWAEVMRAAQLQPPQCDPAADNCGSSWASLYFISFALTGTFVMLNLFIAVVMENFADNAVIPPQKLRVIKRFKRSWAASDPESTEYVTPQDLILVMQRLPSRASALAAVAEAGLRIHGVGESMKVCGVTLPWFCSQPHPSGVYFKDVLMYVVAIAIAREAEGLTDDIEASEDLPPPMVVPVSPVMSSASSSTAVSSTTSADDLPPRELDLGASSDSVASLPP
ncbi:voltage-dependent T-type calcium channel subunit alpha-1I [Thecamonas trahens ATCC 50062]|uniref:Voltage-dependent T-type calcium channel subunit alpha-1I n=1 Tax=Thecamonas trahens ATCC 50062 TaxID=461836 RepID=A0A0L0DFS1_THETB|nr:voltage-dependent T-type calcium channel subunit alpha-1I [Thecamonas trahens ATCC 50062]KNC50163.1 voltage-dependent T-type calcium channel subunit alpha-1I [Thecamonas trahens ATCC 50062]|eukprot:XP_013757005.1 voltage-dependent T-type calcium channel subunit alpha-1I [Thecamonas trahens ATCC 50062]